MLEAWEAADRDPSLIDDGALNVVIVGGGPTGVESAGALAELYRSNFAKDYPDVPQDKARIILVEAGDDAAPDVQVRHPLLRRRGRSTKRGVEVRSARSSPRSSRPG